MTVALEQLAAELAVTPQELERRSLLAYYDFNKITDKC